MGYTVMQFGEGNFIRAFFDWMLQKINERTGSGLSVFLVQPIPSGRVRMILASDHYNVLLRGYRDDEFVEEIDRVEVIRGGMVPGEMEKLLAVASDADLKVVTSNPTEAGIFYKPCAESSPSSYPAMLARVLEERSSEGMAPLYILPLELIEDNGNKLKECVLKHGEDWNYGSGFTDYVESCLFYNTLVDRIVPGYPAGEAEKYFDKLGENDVNLVGAELFHLFVIQGDSSVLDVLPFDKAGLNVLITDRLSFYRTRKVRILNGCHTSMVPIGLLAGVDLVKDFVEDDKFADRVRKMVHEEIVPAFSSADDKEAHAYANDVLTRFRNPALKHNFRDIALNSVSKVNTRLRPTIEDYRSRFGSLPPIMMESVAAMCDLYSKGATIDLPNGPITLRDFDKMDGKNLSTMMESFFPGIGEGLKGEMVSEIGRIRKAGRRR